MNELSAFQRDLLWVTSGLTEPHGLEIKEHLEGYYHSNINHGRLYPNLDALVEMGFLAKSEKDKRTNQYDLTSDGERVLEERREWEGRTTKVAGVA